VELSSRHHVSVEVALALEASRKQREELQAQVTPTLFYHHAIQHHITLVPMGYVLPFCKYCGMIFR